MTTKKTQANQRWERKNPNYIKQWKKDNIQKVKLYYQKDKNKAQKILKGLKINGCAICGYNRCDAALDFHHANPEDKKFSIIRCNIGRKNLMLELNKCILLCKNCHMEKHWCNEEVKNVASN